MPKKLGAPFKPVEGKEDTYTFKYPTGETREFSPGRKTGRISVSKPNKKKLRQGSTLAKQATKATVSSAPKTPKVAVSKKGEAATFSGHKPSPDRVASTSSDKPSGIPEAIIMGTAGVAAGAYGARKLYKARGKIKAKAKAAGRKATARFRKSAGEAHSDNVGGKLPGDKGPPPSTASARTVNIPKGPKGGGGAEVVITRPPTPPAPTVVITKPQPQEGAEKTAGAAAEKTTPKASTPQPSARTSGTPATDKGLPKGVSEIRVGKDGRTEWVLSEKKPDPKTPAPREAPKQAGSPKAQPNTVVITRPQQSTSPKGEAKPTPVPTGQDQPDLSSGKRAKESPSHAGIDKTVADKKKLQRQVRAARKKNAELRKAAGVGATETIEITRPPSPEPKVPEKPKTILRKKEGVPTPPKATHDITKGAPPQRALGAEPSVPQKPPPPTIGEPPSKEPPKVYKRPRQDKRGAPGKDLQMEPPPQDMRKRGGGARRAVPAPPSAPGGAEGLAREQAAARAEYENRRKIKGAGREARAARADAVAAIPQPKGATAVPIPEAKQPEPKAPTGPKNVGTAKRDPGNAPVSAEQSFSAKAEGEKAAARRAAIEAHITAKGKTVVTADTATGELVETKKEPGKKDVILRKRDVVPQEAGRITGPQAEEMFKGAAKVHQPQGKQPEIPISRPKGRAAQQKARASQAQAAKKALRAPYTEAERVLVRQGKMSEVEAARKSEFVRLSKADPVETQLKAAEKAGNRSKVAELRKAIREGRNPRSTFGKGVKAVIGGALGGTLGAGIVAERAAAAPPGQRLKAAGRGAAEVAAITGATTLGAMALPAVAPYAIAGLMAAGVKETLPNTLENIIKIGKGAFEMTKNRSKRLAAVGEYKRLKAEQRKRLGLIRSNR